MENLLAAWREFLPGKTNKKDVQTFESRFFNNILTLHEELTSLSYRHGGYHQFSIADPKPRIIHKAQVRDRLLHHALHRLLYPFFEKKFIADSFSCRIEKGTHRALNRFKAMAYQVSKNHTRTCWVLKCDIRKFFASINHQILKNILEKHIEDRNILQLLGEVIDSFNTKDKVGVGIPLGNLTSQLFANIYMNELDQFMKHRIGAKNYIRYADDFVILSEDRNCLLEILPAIENFLHERLKLLLHPDKVFIKTFASGVDFLGWVHFPNHRVLRTASKKRMLKKIKRSPAREPLYSYFGFLKHGNAKKACWQLLNNYPVWHNI